jgi:quercetin dioxygenase-like cupin family protein
MRRLIRIGVMLLAVIAPMMAGAQPPGPPPPVLSAIVEGMPKGEQQQIRVFVATLKPGDMTPFHTHRFPVTFYVLEGTFSLEMEGRAPVTVTTGQAMVEPPQVKMIGYNRSTSELTRVVIFYVSEPGTPFLDVAQH